MKKVNAVMLRTTTHGEQAFAKDRVVLDMDAGQFDDWKSADLVREATPEEVKAATEAAAATEDKAKPKPSAAR